MKAASARDQQRLWRHFGLAATHRRISRFNGVLMVIDLAQLEMAGRTAKTGPGQSVFAIAYAKVWENRPQLAI